jgi:hypothetical protein
MTVEQNGEDRVAPLSWLGTVRTDDRRRILQSE